MCTIMSQYYVHNIYSSSTNRVYMGEQLVEQELLTLPEHHSLHPVFIEVHVAQVLDFCVVFCRSLFVLLSLFFWPLCCLFFEVRFLITSFTSSNLLQEDTSIYEHHSVFKSSYDMARHVYIVIFNHFVSLLYYLKIICLAIVPLVSDCRK